MALHPVSSRAIRLLSLYEDTSATFLPGADAAFILIAMVFSLPQGGKSVDSMSLKWSVLIHSVRVLVEVNLYLLFLYKQVAAQLTFEAGNLDILIGLSAPLVWWAFSSGRIQRPGLLVWNTLALLSVSNALGRALLSAPFLFSSLRSINRRLEF